MLENRVHSQKQRTIDLTIVNVPGKLSINKYRVILFAVHSNLYQLHQHFFQFAGSVGLHTRPQLYSCSDDDYFINLPSELAIICRVLCVTTCEYLMR